MSARLILVYNADTGLAAALLDAVHKLLSPTTYPCSLCAVTYGTVAMQPRWRAYLRALPLPVAFFHRQDFHAAYPAESNLPLPLIACESDGAFIVLLEAAALDALPDLDSLMPALDAALQRLIPPLQALPAHSVRA